MSTDKITAPENTRVGRTIFIGKPNVNRLFGIPKIKWAYNIKKDFEHKGCKAVDELIWLLAESSGRLIFLRFP